MDMAKSPCVFVSQNGKRLRRVRHRFDMADPGARFVNTVRTVLPTGHPAETSGRRQRILKKATATTSKVGINQIPKTHGTRHQQLAGRPVWLDISLCLHLEQDTSQLASSSHKRQEPLVEGHCYDPCHLGIVKPFPSKIATTQLKTQPTRYVVLCAGKIRTY